MNFVSHIHIAQRALVGPAGSDQPFPSPTPETQSESQSESRGRRSSDQPATPHVLFGAALPDFAAMGRFRLARKPADRWLALGVEAHHRTDEAFHHHRWFTDNSARLRIDIEQLGLGRGPARAIGHVGTELLLDGELLDQLPALRETTHSVLSLAGDRNLRIHDIVARDQQAGWSEHLARIAGWRVTHAHHHPGEVAERLYRILSRRPRLAFDRHRVPAVAKALNGQLEAITTGIDQMLDDVTTRVSKNLPSWNSGGPN